jgi:hypothetical protein
MKEGVKILKTEGKKGLKGTSEEELLRRKKEEEKRIMKKRKKKEERIRKMKEKEKKQSKKQKQPSIVTLIKHSQVPQPETPSHTTPPTKPLPTSTESKLNELTTLYNTCTAQSPSSPTSTSDFISFPNLKESTQNYLFYRLKSYIEETDLTDSQLNNKFIPIPSLPPIYTPPPNSSKSPSKTLPPSNPDYCICNNTLKTLTKLTTGKLNVIFEAVLKVLYQKCGIKDNIYDLGKCKELQEVFGQERVKQQEVMQVLMRDVLVET